MTLAVQPLVPNAIRAVAATGSWPESVAGASEAATRLSPWAGAALNRAAARDTRADDLADLVASAARPGLKDRIRAYRAA